MHALTRRLTLLIFVFALLVPTLAQAENRGLVWKVKGKNCIIWLAGTLHFANESLYPLPKSIEQGFEQAEVLVVEADITNMTEADIEALTQMAAYPPGDGLSKHVSVRMLKEFKDAGMDLAPFEPLRPWYAVMSGVALKLAGMGYSSDMGIDMHMLKRAHDKGMPVAELESIQGQFKLMASLASKDEKGFLRFMLTDIEKMEEQLNILSNAWKQGDGDGMAKELFSGLKKTPAVLPFYDAIYFKRNRGMAEKIAGYLKSGKDHLIMVGAGHLVGPQSVVELLEKKGFKTVQQ